MTGSRGRFEGIALACCVGFSLVAGVARAADVSGTATLVGTVDARKPAKPMVDRKVCGDEIPDGRVAVTEGKLAGVVVWFEGIPAGVVKPGSVEIDQERCRFTPRTTTATAGAELVLVNSDPTLHTVHAYQGRETRFNVATPIQHQRLVQKLDAPGLLELRCDAGHPWMAAYLYVFAHPFHAVSGADGTFVVRDVPVGKWKAKAWHEVFGTIELGEVDVTIEPKTLAVTFDAKAAK